MYFSITTLFWIIFEYISKAYAQGIPISPCPKMFQYRFDGAEWFGILTLHNPDIGVPLHTKVTLSMRGKPTTNYLGEILLLTRGQYNRNTPVLYKVKFPKGRSPPKLVQITANKRVICQGTADLSTFVTQIRLEHTRKFSFIGDGAAGLPPKATEAHGQFINMDTDLDTNENSEYSYDNYADNVDDDVDVVADNLDFLDGNKNYNMKKHFPLAQPKSKPPPPTVNSICGQVDERIRFQMLRPPRTAAALGRKPPIILPADSFDTADAALDIDDSADELLDSLDTADNSGSSFLEQSSLPAISRGAWPWLAAIYVNNLTALAYQCGGTLVTTRIVVSSAHCFHMLEKRYSAHEVLVFLGRHNLRNWSEEGSVAAPVDDIFIHPSYNLLLHNYDADMAVVLLKHEVKFNRYIRPACLWSGNTALDYIVGEQGKVVGWGMANVNATLAGNSALIPAVPRMMSVPIVANELCFLAQPNLHSLASNRTFCAGIAATQPQEVSHPRQQAAGTANPGPCVGDSGTGLLIQRNKRWMLRGTVSATLPTKDGNCNNNRLVIYADVAKFLDWILAFTI